VAGSCKRGNASLRSIGGGVFIDHLSDCQLLNKDSTPWGYGTVCTVF
jgi:hypothetical protein